VEESSDNRNEGELEAKITASFVGNVLARHVGRHFLRIAVQLSA
jgi:hypothetical protein